MLRMFVALCLGSVLFLSSVYGEDKPTLVLDGRVQDPKLQKFAPPTGLIVTEKALQDLWKAWKIEKDMPKIDFTKEFVIVATDKGTGNFVAVLDNKGNVNYDYAGPPSDKPGFAFHLHSHTRTGVKTVKGKPLPKS